MNHLMRRGVQQFGWWKFINRHYAIKDNVNQQNKLLHKKSFDDFVHHRQVEATRSVVVQVNSEKSFPELYSYCNTFGKIISAHHYCMIYDDEHHYILLEYSCAEEAAAAIDSSACNDQLSAVPVRSPFLWFRANRTKRGPKLKTPTYTTTDSPPLDTMQGTQILKNSQINNILLEAPNLEAQIQLLHDNTKLNDLGVRLRFLAALQVQQALTGMFPAANALPFGSSVNGFGKMGCDLDLILRFNIDLPAEVVNKRNDSRLVFHVKENLSNGRSQVQRQMESIGDMLQLFLPGVCHVRRILQARVPIIKYNHEHMNLEVDLSMGNL